MEKRDFKAPDGEIGALWARTSGNGTEYLSGEINGVKVVCFRATKKSERGPDWRVRKSEPRVEERAPRRDESEEPPF